MQTDDLTLTARELGQIENADAVIRLFASMGYDIDDALPVDPVTLGLDGDALKLEVNKVWRVAADPDDGDIVVFLMEVRSVTTALLHTLARRFRERPEQTLLVLTKDYETLDFVLLDRTKEKSKRIGQAYIQVIRPRSLSVNRRNPTRVDLRVIRRFTFTEGDSVLQWEKLRSAFTLAEWTEEYFNNRALFSDYYLKFRVADEKAMPAWGEDVRPVGNEMRKLIVSARQKFTGATEATIREQLYEPAFRLLGFDAVANKPGDSDGGEPATCCPRPNASSSGSTWRPAKRLCAPNCQGWISSHPRRAPSY